MHVSWHAPGVRERGALRVEKSGIPTNIEHLEICQRLQDSASMHVGKVVVAHDQICESWKGKELTIQLRERERERERAGKIEKWKGGERAREKERDRNGERGRESERASEQERARERAHERESARARA